MDELTKKFYNELDNGLIEQTKRDMIKYILRTKNKFFNRKKLKKVLKLL